MLTLNCAHMVSLIAPLLFFSSEWKIEILFIVLLFVMIIVLSTLNVPYAWGGVFIALVGYVLIKRAARNEQGRASAEGKVTKTSKLLKGSINGPVSLFMIIGGLGLAAFDISQNGKQSYAAAKNGTTMVINSISTDPGETVKNMNRAMARDLAQKWFENEKKLIKRLTDVATDDENRQFLTRMEKAIDSIEDEASLKAAKKECRTMGAEMYRMVNQRNQARDKSKQKFADPLMDEKLADVYKLELAISVGIDQFAEKMEWKITE